MDKTWGRNPQTYGSVGLSPNKVASGKVCALRGMQNLQSKTREFDQSNGTIHFKSRVVCAQMVDKI